MTDPRKYLAPLSLLALLAVAGCEAKDPTQIVLVVDTDIPVPGELDGFSLKIERNGVVRTFLTYDLNPGHSASVKLPATLSLVADKELAQRVTITVTGMQGDAPLVVRTARLPFADDRVLMLRLNLLRKCAYLAKPCPPGTTCTAGGCVSVDINAGDLPDWDEAAASKKQDAALVKDAGGDLGRDAPRDSTPVEDKKPDAPAPDRALMDKALPDKAPPDQAAVKPCPAGWCAIPKGNFMMGSPTSEPCRDSLNESRRKVTLTRGFVISATEVTFGQFKSVLGFDPLDTWSGVSPANDAVANTSWHEAAAYCNKLSANAGLETCYTATTPGTTVCGWNSSPNWNWCDKAKNEFCVDEQCYSYSGKTSYKSGNTIYDCEGYRLPTEAEWEYAYRAGSTTAYYNGANTAGMCTGKDPVADKIAYYAKNYYTDASLGTIVTRKVGQKTPNAWGLYDMAGNAREWAHDGYAANLGAADAIDPVTPAGTTHVMRGGSVMGDAGRLRAAWRTGLSPVYREENNFFLGFRCVRTIPSSGKDAGAPDK